MLSKLLVGTAAIAALVTLSACDNRNNTVNRTGEDRVATAPAQPAGPNAGDIANKSGSTTVNNGKAELTSETREYVQEAAMGDMFEIETSKIALSRSPTAEVKQFAQMMVDDHTKTTDELKARLARAGLIVELPTMLDAEHMKKLDDLKAANARAFDTAYIEEQKGGHEEALMLHRGYAMSGDLADLKAFAADVVPKIEMHLHMVTDIESKMRTRVSNNGEKAANTNKR